MLVNNMYYSQLFTDLPHIPFDTEVNAGEFDDAQALNLEHSFNEPRLQQHCSPNLAHFAPDQTVGTAKMLQRFAAPSKDDPFVAGSINFVHRPSITEALLEGQSYLDAQPLWHSMVYPPRQASPVETVRSSVSSNSSVYSFSPGFETPILEPQPHWSIAPQFQPYGEYDEQRKFFTPSSDPCINLREIQSFSDEECSATEPDFMSGGSLFEGANLFHMRCDHESSSHFLEQGLDQYQDSFYVVEEDEAEVYPSDENDSDYKPHRTAPNKRGRPPRDTNLPNGASRSKFSKRRAEFSHTGTKKAVKLSDSQHHSAVPGNTDKKGARPFSCPLTPYGCSITFTSKNEWKRHIISQHLCLGFWRCELCPDVDVSPNNFNRKDLFTQHLRRMHLGNRSDITALQPKPTKGNQGPSKPKSKTARRPLNVADQTDGELEKGLEEIRNRCWVQLRAPPAKNCCAFCKETFTGQGSWEVWLEHTGRHLAGVAKKQQADDETRQCDVTRWVEDDMFRDWLLGHGLLVQGDRKGTWTLPKRRGENDHDIDESNDSEAAKVEGEKD